MDITTIAELAKQGGRLDNDRQWQLADALAILDATDITQVSVQSGRNEDTLLQYARAAQRWPKGDRVTGVSFSAHRVALSWHDPRELLIELKQKHGSPTVRQVRQAMGLEGHIAIELLEKGIKKIDGNVNPDSLDRIMLKLALHKETLEDGRVKPAPTPEVDTPAEVGEDTQAVDTQVIEEGQRWTPPVRTSDIAGM